jgi:hypothetical protein
MQTFATENDILTLKYYIVLFAIAPFLKDENSAELSLAVKIYIIYLIYPRKISALLVLIYELPFHL